MDSNVKRGEVYLQHQKNTEKWKRHWLNLFPASGNGVARLELTNASLERSPVMGRKHPERKIVRLAECISAVRLPPHAEAYPAENMAAFCVETVGKKMVFAVEKEECGQWVEKICDIAFQKSSSNVPLQVPHMEDNQIYASRDEVFDFCVTVQQSEAAVRCGLRGTYWLNAAEDTLVLKDFDSKQTLLEWPYKLLRRYGRDKTMFSIEAGRRCQSGPGAFHFETKQGDEILRFIELAIQQQKTLGVSAGSSSPRTPSSPLPRRQNSAELLDTHINTRTFSLSATSAFSKHVHSNPTDPIGSIEADYVTISSSTTAQTNPSEPICLHEPVYSTPADLFRSNKPDDAIRSQQTQQHRGYSEPVYSDPVDVIRLRSSPLIHVYTSPANEVILPITTETPLHAIQPEPIYAEVAPVAPDSPQKQAGQDQCKDSLPEVTTTHKTQEDAHTSAATESMQDMQSKKVYVEDIYSQVNKVYKSAKTVQRKQEVTSEDLGPI